MAEYTLKLRRYLPESGEAPYWEEFKVDLAGTRSVLDDADKFDAARNPNPAEDCSVESGQATGTASESAATLPPSAVSPAWLQRAALMPRGI